MNGPGPVLNPWLDCKMYCESCNIEFTEGLRYCKWCGGPLVERPISVADLLRCPQCGIEVRTTWGFCKSCGQRLDIVTRRPQLFCTSCGNPVDQPGLVCSKCSPRTEAIESVAPVTAEPTAAGTTPEPGSAPFCPACGEKLDAASAFCRNCGRSVTKAGLGLPTPEQVLTRACNACKAENPPEARVCRVCGTALSGTLRNPRLESGERTSGAPNATLVDTPAFIPKLTESGSLGQETPQPSISGDDSPTVRVGPVPEPERVVVESGKVAEEPPSVEKTPTRAAAEPRAPDRLDSRATAIIFSEPGLAAGGVTPTEPSAGNLPGTETETTAMPLVTADAIESAAAEAPPAGPEEHRGSAPHTEIFRTGRSTSETEPPFTPGEGRPERLTIDQPASGWAPVFEPTVQNPAAPPQSSATESTPGPPAQTEMVPETTQIPALQPTTPATPLAPTGPVGAAIPTAQVPPPTATGQVGAVPQAGQFPSAHPPAAHRPPYPGQVSPLPPQAARPKKSGAGRVIGLAIGIMIGFVVVAGAAFFVWRFKHARANLEQPVASPTPLVSESQPTPEPSPSPTAPPIPEGMVLVPAGDYTIGRNDGDTYSAPEHKVTLQAFYIDQTEVTNGEYKKFIDATGHKPPEGWDGNDYPPSEEDYPVINVSWKDASDYAVWAGKRLPTEAEWEAAARGPEGLLYPWGNDWRPGAANMGTSGVVAVGSYKEGASPFGALDMIGNVWEWTSDEFKVYPDNPAKLPDAMKPGIVYRVIRGGAFDGSKANDATYRGFVDQDKGYPKTGFRCAKDAEVRQGGSTPGN